MTGMLAMGLPLEDFIGFRAVSTRIFHANPDIVAIVVRDRGGRIALSAPEGSPIVAGLPPAASFARSEEHTSELQSLMRISYAVFCLKKKKNTNRPPSSTPKSTNSRQHARTSTNQ